MRIGPPDEIKGESDLMRWFFELRSKSLAAAVQPQAQAITLDQFESLAVNFPLLQMMAPHGWHSIVGIPVRVEGHFSVRECAGGECGLECMKIMERAKFETDSYLLRR